MVLFRNSRGDRWFRKGTEALESARLQSGVGNAILFAEGWDLPDVQKFSSAVTQHCLEEALECFEKGLEFTPWHLTAKCNKWLALTLLRRHEEARSYVEACLRDAPRHGRLWWLEMAQTLQNLDRPAEEVIDCYDKVIARAPDSSYAWHNKGKLLRDLGRHDEAGECLTRAFLAHLVSGSEVSAPHLALDLFDRALDIRPASPLAWAKKGEVLARLRRHTETEQCNKKALDLADEAIQIDDKDALAWTAKGLATQTMEAYAKSRAYVGVGAPAGKKARQCYERAMRLGDTTFAPEILKAGVRPYFVRMN